VPKINVVKADDSPVIKGNPAPLVDIRDLVVEFKTERSLVHALNGVNLQIKQGESLGLVGEAGAGKTTTALGILNLMSPQAAKVKDGDIRYSGKSVFQMSNRELLEMRGGKVSMIFQNPLTSLNPVFTVGEQIAVLLRKHMKMNRRQAMIEASKLLEMVGISGTRVNDYPHQFSGGMRQRVGIAAALACRPELLIADEPTTALDVTIQAQILELMKELQEKYSTSLLMITHNLGIISELCQRVAVMYAGRIIESGTVAQVFARPAHPYTMGLLNALPKLTGPRERLTAIPGRVADPQNLPQGCSFHPRCANCTEQCKQKTPAMTQITSEHSVACFNPMS
jgi:peptide/nickel transport system ATP-binding protein